MINLVLTREQKDRLWAHLLPRKHRNEEAAFLFVQDQMIADTRRLVCQDMWLLGPTDFAYQSHCHIELAEKTHGTVIKRAHDMQAAIIELHSHVGKSPAQFSPSDLMGFEEWVPHVRRRLKGRPYGALVVTKGDFDGFLWDSKVAERIGPVEVLGGRSLHPNGRSPLSWSFRLKGG